MSKYCGHHDEERRQLLRRIFAGIITFIILILLLIFLIWIILQPTKPHFIIQNLTVYNFNLSTTTTTINTEPSFSSPIPNTLSTTVQATISSFNPNARVGIYYQKLGVYASYRGQQISSYTMVPVTYQGHREATVWSPFLYGDTVPVSPYVLSSLQQDQVAGGILVNVKINGRVKWKVGTWVSGRYHIDVNCPAYITLGGGRNNEIGVATAVMKFQTDQTCNVDV
ncbi:unnamed protein product [Lupinus luteus]|uniref:Late embryogenesis abundant protein LEA-2 subgroup domain-containing protein n=1 Tax=Lupinus luteus TaxID=3873 RepID=A0AAV1YDX7_LUPLU